MPSSDSQEAPLLRWANENTIQSMVNELAVGLQIDTQWRMSMTRRLTKPWSYVKLRVVQLDRNHFLAAFAL